MGFKKYDIILTNFPFSDLSETKVRPALVLKPLEGENTILLQITTQKRGISRYEVPLPRKLCEGDIRFDSNIYLDMIFTLHESLVIKKLGSVKDEKVKQEVDKKFKEMFFD